MYINIDSNYASGIVVSGPIITVFTKDEKGVADGMTAAWVCPYDPDVVLVVLDKSHTTSENILKTGKFVVAVPSKDQLETALKLGSVHGRDLANKLEALNVDCIKSDKFGFDVMKGALAYIECELSDKDLFADKGICLGKVVNISVEKDFWDESEEAFRPGCFNNIRYIGAHKFMSGGQELC
ncbi:MAG: flavin reductase family protein [Succinivibrio sp.]